MQSLISPCHALESPPYHCEADLDIGSVNLDLNDGTCLDPDDGILCSGILVYCPPIQRV